MITPSKPWRKSIALGAENPGCVFVTYARALQLSGKPIGRVLDGAKDLVERLPNRPRCVAACKSARESGRRQDAGRGLRPQGNRDRRQRACVAGHWPFSSAPNRSGPPRRKRLSERPWRSLKRTTSAPRARFLAEFLVHRGEETAAQETMAKWFADDKPCYCCAVLEGDIAARSGNPENASRAYRSALELRGDGIHALTGLSRFVDREEGEKLIARAMASDPFRPPMPSCARTPTSGQPRKPDRRRVRGDTSVVLVRGSAPLPHASLAQSQRGRPAASASTWSSL